MWIATVPAPDCPIYAVHQYLWSYFDVGRGEIRPFLFRAAGGQIDMLSRIRPSCPARPVDLKSGRSYQFSGLLSPVNGDHRSGSQKSWRAIPHEDLNAWLGRRLSGADVRYAHFQPLDMLKFLKPDGTRIHVTRVMASGVIYVSDRAEFAQSLLSGPGKAKSWGCGLLWLPEAFETFDRDETKNFRMPGHACCW